MSYQPAPGAALMPWLFPAMLALTALDVLMSGRNLNETFAHLQRSAEAAAPLIERGSLQVWAQRAVSMLLVLATLQRITAHVLHGRPAPAPLLSAAFLLYWAATIAAPGLLGAHPRVSHEYLYPLLLGLACTMTEPFDQDRILPMLRNALFAFMLAGLPLLAVHPALVLESTYTQGLLPGLPRYGGLASSPVMMGMLAQVALLVLWAEPFRRRWLHVAAWTFGLAVLVVAQSKIAWLGFVAGGACMWIVQSAGRSPYGLAHPRRSGAAAGLCLCVIGAALALLAGTLVLDLPGVLEGFLQTPEGAQLASLTGRDRIWIVALEEWRDHPVFGYGLSMWDSEYRQEVGLPQATHAHNQFVDTLGRAGTIGAAGLLVYAAVLIAFALRHARAGGGLGLAMGVTVALLCVSEVPLLLVDYGSHLLQHYLLLACVSAAAARSVPALRPAGVPARMAGAMVGVRIHGNRRLRAVGLTATKALLAASIPLLMVGSPLADGTPGEAANGGALQLTLARQLGDTPRIVPDGASARIDEPVRLAFERTLRTR